MNIIDLLQNASFFSQLLKLDILLSQRQQALGCKFCGGKLHRAPYERKPRGIVFLITQQFLRLSLCCADCRKRSLPSSCIFLGRRVYFGCVILLVTSILQGLTSSRIKDLCAQFQVSKRTLKKWLLFFRDVFPKSDLWQKLRGRLSPDIASGTMPLTLVQSWYSEKGFFEACCFLVAGFFPTEVQVE